MLHELIYKYIENIHTSTLRIQESQDAQKYVDSKFHTIHLSWISRIPNIQKLKL